MFLLQAFIFYCIFLTALLEWVEAAFAAVTKWLFMVVKLSVIGFHWVSVIVLPRPPHEQLLQDFDTRWQKFWWCYKKYIDRLEIKMTNLDPSIDGQHFRPLKNNYFKPWKRLIFLFTSAPWSVVGEVVKFENSYPRFNFRSNVTRNISS